MTDEELLVQIYQEPDDRAKHLARKAEGHPYVTPLSVYKALLGQLQSKRVKRNQVLKDQLERNEKHLARKLDIEDSISIRSLKL